MDISEAFNAGDFYKGRYCHLFVKEAEEGPTRGAFVISSKTAGNAVDRNRIRRLMKESFRLALPRLEEGWLLVFLATRSARPELKRQQFDDQLEQLFEEAGFFENSDHPSH